MRGSGVVTDADSALHGVLVLEVGLLVQGPLAAQTLGDLGADVIKVELPGVGDYSRWIPASGTDRRPPWFIACNRGKRSVSIDLRTAGGAELFRDLCAHADVVVSNFSPGTMERWGLGYTELAARNQGLIYAHGTAFGPAGERAGTGGLDLSLQASAGLVSVTGPAGSGGFPVGATIGDYIGGQNLALGVLAALLYRARTGQGQEVTTSVLGGLLHAQGPEITAFALTKASSGPAGHGHPVFRSLYGVFPTADGQIAITHIPEESKTAFWRLVGIDRAQAEAAQLDDRDGADRQALLTALSARLETEPGALWCERFDQLAVGCALVRDYDALLRDPSVFAAGYLQEIHHEKWGDIVGPGTPIGLSASPVRPGQDIPAVGAHTQQVLRELLGR
jgi:crotonobetainyl-CoA:carnitine CoA-transferase CaiB-like acyl-CoA transferase